MEHLKTWNRLNQPPTWALKTIGAGRLKGKSDINPQWRYHALTEVFGPCGIGWKFTIDKLWLEPGNGNEIFAFAQVSLYFSEAIGETWSAPIPGIGGSKLVQQESAGPHNNDEAYKMAVTDALSTACKMLGVASDIYMGLWDGSKYITPQNGQKKPEQKNSESTEKPSGNMSDKQSAFIIKIGMGLKDPYSPLSKDEVVELVRWKAKQLNVDPKSKAVADAFLPRKDETIKPWEKFASVFEEWMEWKQGQSLDDIPVFDEQGNEVCV